MRLNIFIHDEDDQLLIDGMFKFFPEEEGSLGGLNLFIKKEIEKAVKIQNIRDGE